MIKSFIDTDDVRFIFVDYRLQRVLYEHAAKQGVPKARLRELFQYPRSRAVNGGIIRHEPGHATHFHVRFKKARPPAPPNS